MTRFLSLVVFYLRCGFAALLLVVGFVLAVEFLLPWALRGGAGTDLIASIHLVLWPASLLGLGFASADRNDLARLRLLPIDLRVALGARLLASEVLGAAVSALTIALPSFRSEVLVAERFSFYGPEALVVVLLALLPTLPALAGTITKNTVLQLGVVLTVAGVSFIATVRALSPYLAEPAARYWYLLAVVPPLAWAFWRSPELAARQKSIWLSMTTCVVLSLVAPAAYLANIRWLHLGSESFLVPHLELVELLDPRSEAIVLVGTENSSAESIELSVGVDNIVVDREEMRHLADYQSVKYFWQVGEPAPAYFPAGARLIRNGDLVIEEPAVGARPESPARAWYRNRDGRLASILFEQKFVRGKKGVAWRPFAGRDSWLVGIHGGELVHLELGEDTPQPVVIADDFLRFQWFSSYLDDDLPHFAFVRLGPASEPEGGRLALVSGEARLIELSTQIPGSDLDGAFLAHGESAPTLVVYGCRNRDRSLAPELGPQVCSLYRVNSETGICDSTGSIGIDHRFGRFFSRGDSFYSFERPETPLLKGLANPKSRVLEESRELALLEVERGRATLIDSGSNRFLDIPLHGSGVYTLRRGRWFMILSGSGFPKYSLVDLSRWVHREGAFPAGNLAAWFLNDDLSPYERYDWLAMTLRSELVGASSGLPERLILSTTGWWYDGGAAPDPIPRFALLDPESGQWQVPKRPTSVERWLRLE